MYCRIGPIETWTPLEWWLLNACNPGPEFLILRRKSASIPEWLSPTVNPASDPIGYYDMKLKTRLGAALRQALDDTKIAAAIGVQPIAANTQPAVTIADGVRNIAENAIAAQAARNAERAFDISPTGQRVLFRGKSYDLSRHPRAARVLAFLWAEHQKGAHRVTIEMIRRQIGQSHGGSMYDWFRGTGLWKTLVVQVDRGVYRLDLADNS
jgi:hypothetical protein